MRNGTDRETGYWPTVFGLIVCHDGLSKFGHQVGRDYQLDDNGPHGRVIPS
jgi:hypothetical protein